MVSFHHGYQALQRGIARQVLPEPARVAVDFMAVLEQALSAHELRHGARFPPCQGMASSFMPTAAAPAQPSPSPPAA
eukprot:2950085-Pleurochrysis_carterae.AAC.1